MMISVEDYVQEKNCIYKDEEYRVRDNGAILRLPSKIATRKRQLDYIWTFGKKNEKTGYMLFSGEAVHRIVATAFWGKPQYKDMVVDHIDTNRCNNRPENLRWVTKLENTLNNPITRKKIIFYCGSIEAFLENPSLLQENALDPNVQWMRTVSLEEAAICKRNLERWSKEDKENTETKKFYNGEGVGEWIYQEARYSYLQTRKGTEGFNPPIAVEDEGLEEKEEEIEYTESLTKNVIQSNWNTPTEFPLCPVTIENGLVEYYNNLTKDAVFCYNNLWKSIIVDKAISEDGLQRTFSVDTENIF